MRNAYSVATFNPFWRYAVALDNRPDLPAIPFTTLRRALVGFDCMTRDLPRSVPVLLRRRLFGRVNVVQLARDEAKR